MVIISHDYIPWKQKTSIGNCRKEWQVAEIDDVVIWSNEECEENDYNVTIYYCDKNNIREIEFYEMLAGFI